MSDSSDNLRVFSTDPEMPVQLPAGNEVPPPRPTAKFGDPYVDGMGRDVQTDSRRMSDVDSYGLTGNIMDDRDMDDEGWQCDSRVTSIGNEKRRGGWDPLATPSEGIPGRRNTSGTRGADDIMPFLPADGSMP